MSADTTGEASTEPTADPPDGRCGYPFSLDSPLAGERGACCWRESWRNGRCRWHADADKGGVIDRHDLVEHAGPLVGAVLRGAELSGSGALRERSLSGADLSEVDLRHADLSGAVLAEADLADADLTGADLTDADLTDADLTGATLADADLDDVDARGATFAEANMEKCSLARTNLRAADLTDTRLYEAAFSDTWINQETDLDDRCVYEREADGIDREEGSIEAHDAASWTYRSLQGLCGENALPNQSRHYYVREKDARRKHAWEVGDYTRAVKSELSRWTMEYGSNAWRVVGFSAVVILVFAVAYPLVGGLYATSPPLSELGTAEAEPIGKIGYFVEAPTENVSVYFGRVFLKSLYFSVVTFTTLGYGDIQPIGDAVRVLATVETILGSVLLALLVFVLSRQVTW
jgi:hypothetical protein